MSYLLYYIVANKQPATKERGHSLSYWSLTPSISRLRKRNGRKGNVTRIMLLSRTLIGRSAWLLPFHACSFCRGISPREHPQNMVLSVLKVPLRLAWAWIDKLLDAECVGPIFVECIGDGQSNSGQIKMMMMMMR